MFDEGYIWREEITLKRVKIPENHVVCPDCKGTGKQIKIYKDPGPNEYMTCFKCMGKGYVKTVGGKSLNDDKGIKQ